MTTYCLNPNETWLAVYNLNTATMPTNNVVFSDLIADLSASWTSATIKAWEWELFSVWMIATIEQLNSEWKATAREVILINGITDNVLSITRWYEKCVQDDTASPKTLWNTPKAFTTWARISVYVSKALLNWVQTRLKQVNCPCNTSVYNQALAMTNWIDACCDFWWWKLYDKLACKCWLRNWVFWNGCDWDLVISQSDADECWFYYLCANHEYQFNNLTICEWVTVRFEKQWVPVIRVRNHFINKWVIDLRWWYCTWACSYSDDITWTTISNMSCDICPNKWWAWGCWISRSCACYRAPWYPWCDGTDSCWWDGWNWAPWEKATCWQCAVGMNWGNGWRWACRYYGWGWGGWGWGGWWRYWKWGNGWVWWYTDQQTTWWYWGSGWNGWPRWTGWEWWAWWYTYWWNGWIWWPWWNWFIWWEWWYCCCAWVWGLWVLRWGKGWDASCIQWYSAKWGNAVCNMFWLLLTARTFDNADWIICSRWWDWWDGWNGNWSNCNTWYATWSQWGNGADWWCSVIVYWNCISQWIIDNTKWKWWLWGWTYASEYCCSWRHRVSSWCDGNDWSCKICRFTY